MRDAGRIPIVLAAIEREWKRDPDIRLGQLLMNLIRREQLAPREDEGMLLFGIEDGELLRLLGPQTATEQRYVEDEPGQAREGWRDWTRSQSLLVRHATSFGDLLSTIAYEMARTTLARVLEAHESERLAKLADEDINRLKAAAAAQVYALAHTPTGIIGGVPKATADRLVARAKLSVPLVGVYAILLRDRVQPLAYDSAALAIVIAPMLAEADRSISSSTPSASHSQQQVTDHQRELVATAAELDRVLARAGGRKTPDYVPVVEGLMQQTTLRQYWLTPWVLGDEDPSELVGEGSPAAMSIREARATLGLGSDAGVEEAVTAIGALFEDLFSELLRTGQQSDGPRRRWLAELIAIETLAGEP